MKLARCVLSTCLALLAGCSGLLHRDAAPDQTYVLRARPSGDLEAAADAPSLRIGRTITAPGLDADRLVLVRSDHRVDYFAASRWLASIPQMVEDLAAETLRSTGTFSSVHDSQGAFATDFFLQLDIRRFEADYTQSTDPKVFVVIDCTLGRRTDRERLSHFVASGSAAADANRMASVVAAFESALQGALGEIAQHTGEAVRTSTAPSTP